MLAIANGSVNPIEQSLTMPNKSAVSNEHKLSHFEANENLTPLQRIKNMENELIRLGVDKKELSDPDEDPDQELKDRRKNTDKKNKEKELDQAIKEDKKIKRISLLLLRT